MTTRSVAAKRPPSARTTPSGWDWLRASLFFGIGGAIFVFITLWLVSEMASLFEGGRMTTSDEGGIIGAIILVWSIIYFVTMGLLRAFGKGWLRSTLIPVAWLGAYVILWLVGAATGGIGLPFFVIFWIVIGALIGLILRHPEKKKRGGPRPQSSPRSSRPKKPPTYTLAEAAGEVEPPERIVQGERMTKSLVIPPTILHGDSAYGRIPAGVVALLRQEARLAEEVVFEWPPDAPRDLRDFTVRAILQRVITDWWKNANTKGLDGPDVVDLRSFVELARALADDRFDSDGKAIYRATLSALLDDWLANWNAKGFEGPPVRE